MFYAELVNEVSGKRHVPALRPWTEGRDRAERFGMVAMKRCGDKLTLPPRRGEEIPQHVALCLRKRIL